MIRAEANDATTRTAHGFDKAFPSNKLYLGITEPVFPFDLTKLAKGHIVRILVFFDTGFQDLGLEYLEGTSKNSASSPNAIKLPANDSASFSFRFIYVHSGAVSDRQWEQFFEVPSSLFLQRAS